MNSPRGFLKRFQNSYLDACSVLCEDIAAEFLTHCKPVEICQVFSFGNHLLVQKYLSDCVMCVLFVCIFSKEMERNYGFNDTV